MHCRLIFKRNGCHVVFFLQIRLPEIRTKQHPVSALSVQMIIRSFPKEASSHYSCFGRLACDSESQSRHHAPCSCAHDRRDSCEVDLLSSNENDRLDTCERD